MADAQPATDSPSKIKKLLVPLFALFNLGVMGGGSYLVYVSTLGYHAPSSSNSQLYQQYLDYKTSHEDKAVTYRLEPFTVNLDGFPQRVLRVEMSLEMLDEEGFEEIVSMGAGTKDQLLRILNAKNQTDLESIQGKLTLKDEMRTALNSTLKKGVVKDIYFSDFVIQ